MHIHTGVAIFGGSLNDFRLYVPLPVEFVRIEMPYELTKQESDEIRMKQRVNTEKKENEDICVKN